MSGVRGPPTKCESDWGTEPVTLFHSFPMSLRAGRPALDTLEHRDKKHLSLHSPVLGKETGTKSVHKKIKPISK